MSHSKETKVGVEIGDGNWTSLSTVRVWKKTNTMIDHGEDTQITLPGNDFGNRR